MSCLHGHCFSAAEDGPARRVNYTSQAGKDAHENVWTIIILKYEGWDGGITGNLLGLMQPVALRVTLGCKLFLF